jgi:hypothetical protein
VACGLLKERWLCKFAAADFEALPMTFRYPSKRHALMRMLVLVLPLWWGGLNCVTACSMESWNVPAAEVCAAEAGQHSCCVSFKQQGTGNLQLPAAPGRGDCSALENFQASLPTKQSVSAKRLATPFLPAFALPQTNIFTTSDSLRPTERWLNGQNTFLHCCVFLI